MTIALEDVTLSYERHPAVHHLTGAFASGSLTAVVGPNGAGKSTLLKGLAGVMSTAEGRVDWGGLQRRDIAYLPQQSAVERSFPISVTELVSMGLWSRIGAFGRMTREGRDKIAIALEAVGLADFGRRALGTLSGGQLQRALFARILVQDAPVILLDEPFTAIDSRTTADLMELVQRWHGEARTVIAVLHDLELVQKRFPQSLLLAREPIAWGATPEVVTPENLLHARRHCEAWDERADVCHRDAA